MASKEPFNYHSGFSISGGKVAEVVAEFELFKFHMARFNIPAPDKLTGETQ